MNHKLNLKDGDKNFVGEGSYGCTYFPGIDCTGKKNKKQYLTKVEEINFFSNNEIVISKMSSPFSIIIRSIYYIYLFNVICSGYMRNSTMTRYKNT